MSGKGRKWVIPFRAVAIGNRNAGFVLLHRREGNQGQDHWSEGHLDDRAVGGQAGGGTKNKGHVRNKTLLFTQMAECVHNTGE